MTVSMRTVIERLGFATDWTSIGNLPGYRYDFSNFSIKIDEVYNKHFNTVLWISGNYSTDRRISMIDFEAPLDVESYEQGVALIAYALRRCPPSEPVEWLTAGHLWEEHLPWKQEMKAYEARPQCTVERDWFRMPARRLRELAQIAVAGDKARFGFDGQVLMIATSYAVVPMPAQGEAWLTTYSVKLHDMQAIPKRLAGPRIYIGVWEGQLSIDGRRIPLLTIGEQAA